MKVNEDFANSDIKSNNSQVETNNANVRSHKRVLSPKKVMTPLKSKQSNRYSNANQKVTSSINENKQKLNEIIANAQQLTYP